MASQVSKTAGSMVSKWFKSIPKSSWLSVPYPECSLRSTLSSRFLYKNVLTESVTLQNATIQQLGFGAGCQLTNQEMKVNESLRNRLDFGVMYPPSRLPITINVPHGRIIQPFESPKSTTLIEWIDDSLSRPDVIDKTPSSNIKKEAARLVVIRRKKMNKHKLRKLRKRMKYVFAKIRLRRQIRYEKEFLNTQMARIREAQRFDAKAYVADILRRAKAEPFPTRWEGKFYPESMIREKMELDAKRKRQEYLSILDKRSIVKDKQ